MKIPMEDWLRGCVFHDGRNGEVMLPTDKVIEIANYIQKNRTSVAEGMIELMPEDDESRTMTRARAVELLKGFQLCCDFDDCTNAWDCDECVEALNLAIEALEQQSPCDMCENEKKDWWEMCQFCPAKPKGSDEE